MRDSVPSARYSPVCNVLRQWKTSLIPTYRVYRLYDDYKVFKYNLKYKFIQLEMFYIVREYMYQTSSALGILKKCFRVIPYNL